MGEHEITSPYIGELVMQSLTQLDPVAYIRYASVYKDFRATQDFESFIEKENLQETNDTASPSELEEE